MHEYLAIGCSHTKCVYMDAADRWTERIAAITGQPFFYRDTCRPASGLINMQRHAMAIFASDPKQVKWLVIQKPQALRFPWWISNWQQKVSSSRYDKFAGIDLCVGRKQSQQLFSKQKTHARRSIANKIYEEELTCIHQLRNFFTEANIVYFHYWADYVMDSLHFPELAEVNVHIGEAVESMGIQNWKMIVKLEDIPGALDSEGDFWMDNDVLSKHRWIRHPGDLHPGLAFHDAMLAKVKKWVSP